MGPLRFEYLISKFCGYEELETHVQILLFRHIRREYSLKILYFFLEDKVITGCFCLMIEGK